MAIPSRQIGWGTEDNLLWQISKQLEQLTNVTAKACTNCTTTTTTTTAPAYRVFTALLTQSGGDSPAQANYENEGPLVIGQSYFIDDNLPLVDGGTDFTNVGAANNNSGTWFIATGTTPIWGANGGVLTYNEGAPVATVLENTIGNIWWSYSEAGVYVFSSDGLFTLNKTLVFPGNASHSIGVAYPADINTGELDMNNPVGARVDGILYQTAFEIRVYN
jgi:hypothetical protein